jgi:hypothetical protein
MSLVPVEASPLALAAMTHLGVVNADDAIRTHSPLETGPVLPALDVLKQQPLQKKRRLMQPPALGIARGKLLHRLSGHHQHAIGIRDHASKNACLA